MLPGEKTVENFFRIFVIFYVERLDFSFSLCYILAKKKVHFLCISYFADIMRIMSPAQNHWRSAFFKI